MSVSGGVATAPAHTNYQTSLQGHCIHVYEVTASAHAIGHILFGSLHLLIMLPLIQDIQCRFKKATKHILEFYSTAFQYSSFALFSHQSFTKFDHLIFLIENSLLVFFSHFFCVHVLTLSSVLLVYSSCFLYYHNMLSYMTKFISSVGFCSSVTSQS